MNEVSTAASALFRHMAIESAASASRFVNVDGSLYSIRISKVKGRELAIRVDDEYNAVKWWDNLRERYPKLAASLEKNNCAIITDHIWCKLMGLDGFFDGPSHAETPLLSYYMNNDNAVEWNEIVTSPHDTFEVAE